MAGNGHATISARPSERPRDRPCHCVSEAHGSQKALKREAEEGRRGVARLGFVRFDFEGGT